MGNNFSKTNVNRKYQYKRDTLDERDLKHQFELVKYFDAIMSVDYRSKCPPVYDQGKLGSCTANAIAAAYEFDEMKEEESNVFTPSRLGIYYNEREMEGNVEVDDGAELRDGIKTINRCGVFPETMWPYDISKFNVKPPAECYVESSKHKAVEYKRVEQNLDQMKQCLINGYPFVFGIDVYESFELDSVVNTGVILMPKEGEKKLGGHALMCCGFLVDKGVFIVRNSWGVSWGQGGYGYLPFDYMLSNMASDFWTVTRVKD
jgi:C1A family cysteine protease